MEDLKLINRKDSYRKCKFTIMESRERYNLSLRKQNIEEYIFNRRIKTNNTNKSLTFEINPYDLDIDSTYKDFQITDIENDIELIQEMITSNSNSYKKFAVYSLRIYFVKKDPERKDDKIKLLNLLTRSNIIDILCEIISTSTDVQIIFETFWIMINLPYKGLDSEDFDLKIFCKDYLMEAYIKHVRSQYEDIIENLMWFLSNIAEQSAECRDILIHSKIYGEVMGMVRKEENSFSILENSLYFLAIMMKQTTTIPSQKKVLDCLEVFAGYLYTNDQKIVAQCLWGIYNITQFDREIPSIFDEIIKSGAVVKMIKLNFSKYQMCMVPTIRVLGNLCAGDFTIVDDLLNMNILDFFDHMLTINNEKPIMREIVWAITNISAGRINQCEKVMDSAVLERVYDYLTDYDLKLKKEAVFVIRNMCTTGSLEITIKVVDQGVLKKLCELLEKEKNEIILITCLETLLNIFHMGEILKEFEKENRFIKEFDEYAGVTLLENLQNHKDIDIFNLAQKILEMFYITQEVTN